MSTTAPPEPGLSGTVARDPAGHPVRGRLENLDALRAIFALAVLAVHAYALGGRAAPLKAVHPYDVALLALPTGVWGFFAISGYVISAPFVDALLGIRSPPGWGRYAIRRAARILPLYWVVLAVYIAVDGSAGTRAWQLPIHFLLLHNLVPGRQEALFSPAWTLTVELLFYVLVPLLAALAARTAGRRPLSAERLAGWLLASWAASIAFTAAADLAGDGRIGLWLRGLVPAMWQMFCPGILLAIAPHLSGRWRERIATLPRRPGVIGAGAVIWLVGLLLQADAPLRFGIVPYQLMVDAGRPCMAIGYGLLLAAAIDRRAWRGRPLVGLGVISYGIYLIHPVIEAILLKAGLVPLHRDTLPAFIVHVGVLAGLTIPVAALSWRWFERPLIDLAKRA